VEQTRNLSPLPYAARDKVIKPAYLSKPYVDSLLDAKKSLGSGTSLKSQMLQTMYDPDILSAEIEALCGTEFFGKYLQRTHPYEEGDDMFSALTISSIAEDIKAKAPILNMILRDLLERQRSTVGGPRDCRNFRLITILSVICVTRHPIDCNSFQTYMGLLLHSQGVPKNVITLMQRLGISIGHGSLFDTFSKVNDEASKEISALGELPHAVVVYDNLEQLETVKEQGIDNQGKFHSVTTGIVMEEIEMPNGELETTMLSRKPMPFNDMAFSKGIHFEGFRGKAARTFFLIMLTSQIRKHFVMESLRKTFPESFHAIFDSNHPAPLLEIDRIPWLASLGPSYCGSLPGKQGVIRSDLSLSTKAQ
jgi:hypothetical protein